MSHLTYITFPVDLTVFPKTTRIHFGGWQNHYFNRDVSLHKRILHTPWPADFVGFLCSLKVKWRLAAWSAKSKVKPPDVDKAVKTLGTETLSTEYPTLSMSMKPSWAALHLINLNPTNLVCSGYRTSAFATTWRMLRTRCPSMRECLHRGCVPILHECIIPWPHQADVSPNFSCGFDCVPQDYTDTFRGLAKSSFQSWRFPIYDIYESCILHDQQALLGSSACVFKAFEGIQCKLS